MAPANKIQYITNEKGEKTSVILPVETYEEMLEDIQDLVSVAERREEASIPLDQVLKSLKADGII